MTFTPPDKGASALHDTISSQIDSQFIVVDIVIDAMVLSNKSIHFRFLR
jgi:hypothetical protein